MKKNKINKISVIVPVYNEILVIEQFVIRLSDTLDQIKFPYEVIFVDDNSSDGTNKFLKALVDNESVFLIEKKGKKGKAFSLFEGFAKASGDAIVMIDGDLQYPPENILEMVSKLDELDIVVAHRKKNDSSRARRVMSSAFRNFFGKKLFGLSVDIQSGLKVFRKEVIQTVRYVPRSGWTFDLEFLHRAQEAGYKIGGVDIHFSQRRRGSSKISILGSSIEIGINALSVRIRKLYPMQILPSSNENMIGAGIGYKRKQFLTHSTLPHRKSALRTFEAKQIFLFFALLLLLIVSVIYQPLSTIKYFIGVLSFVYFLDVLFNLYLIGRSLYSSKELKFSDKELEDISEKDLPTYTILCPLYKEAHIIPHFLDSISKLDYPKRKLEVMLLLEEDDKHSIESVGEMNLPSYVRVVVVPDSQPKTKPKACNYGLSLATGEYLVIYDAEDMPEPDQLKKAVLGFGKVDERTICLQAKLNYYNPHQNLLTRFFTAEYSLWFDLTLTGLQTLNTSLPLGGTSNHFRVKDLLKLHGWDAFNVTEDADLGIRLFKEGYKTAMIDSTTLEEANSQYKNWIRQRSRWVKGYMQTYIVHMREMFKFAKSQKHHAVYFQLILGGKIAFILINPILWIATLSYFTLYSIVGPTIESLYPAVVFYMAVISLVLGNFLFLYYYMIGCMKREQYSLIKYIYLVPIYWIMISIAGAVAFYQLLFKPHYWEKTLHGLHLLPKNKKVVSSMIYQAENIEQSPVSPTPAYLPALSSELSKKNYFSGFLLVASAVVANLLNLLFATYIGRTVGFDDFALISLMGGLLYLSRVPSSGFTGTVNQRSAFLDGRFGAEYAIAFWQKARRNAFFLSLLIAFLWVISIPFLTYFFKSSDFLPFHIFTLIWLVSFVSAVDRGYISGKLMFGSLAVINLIEPIIKLVTAILLIHFHFTHYIYISITASILGVFILSWLIVRKYATRQTLTKHEITKFPKKYYFISLLSSLSNMAFLSLDLVLAKHFLPVREAGIYSLISTSGKMIYFSGSLASQFLVPLVSKKEGQRKDSIETFYVIIFSTVMLTAAGFVAFGVFGYLTLPLIFGAKAIYILPYMTVFSFAMMSFAVAKVFESYYLAKKIYSFTILAFCVAIFQIFLISVNHDGIYQFVLSMTITGILSLATSFGLHLFSPAVQILERNIADLSEFFKAKKNKKIADNKLRILIYNWRDTHHKWAGGAEVYAHEIAKRLVKDGNKVTLFTANDGNSSRNQRVDGVKVVRRGGAYTVYFWAAIYYFFKFRKSFDVIVDCENGIPFFTPLYARRNIFLVIHHIHQEVFHKHLPLPLAYFAGFLEGKVMPFFYRNTPIITVSQSSKKEILNVGLGKQGNIFIVPNGIDRATFGKREKAKNPLFMYLGRLKDYKNIDVAIKAFAKVIEPYPQAQFLIVGTGESEASLKKLVRTYNLSKNVQFLGHISERAKAAFLGRSWVVLQPSMMEGWGITVIEANASGTPVIASNVSGLRDSIVDGKTGVLVPVGNVNGLAREMLRFVNDPEYRKEYSKNAYEWSKNFSWDSSASDFYAILSRYDSASDFRFNIFNDISLARE